MDPNSKIIHLFRHEDKYKHLLLNLLFKAGFRHIFATPFVLDEFILRTSVKKSTDTFILKRLRNVYLEHGKSRNDISGYKKSRESRANLRWDEIGQINLLSIHNLSVSKYLDFGAGDCSMAVLLGQKMGVKPENIYAVDIENWEGKIDDMNVYRPQCQFQTYDGVKLPYPNNKFDFITAFQVLHHIEHLEEILAEIHRVMSVGGILVIREHHCHNKKMERLIQIEHMLHDQVFTLETSSEETFSCYRKRKDLKEYIKDAGFVWSGKYFDQDPQWNPTNYYYEAYFKI